VTYLAATKPVWFDAHLDLAYLAVNRRDMLLSPSAPGRALLQAPPHPPSCVSLTALADANVRFALATIFTERVETPADADAPEKYAAASAVPAEHAIETAHKAGRAQLEVYLTWRDRGLVAIDLPAILKTEPGTGEIRGGMGVAEPTPVPAHKLMERALARDAAKIPPPLHIGILIENADPIRSPEELGWWIERGIVAIGMAWTKPSRYAGGNGTQTGITDLGRALVREMDRLRIVHDASHLSDRALGELFDLTGRPIMASHSNCRELLAGTSAARQAIGASGHGVPIEVLVQRHLTDDQIRQIVSRGGVIGLNLYSRFLESKSTGSGRAPLESAIRHIEHTCEVAAGIPGLTNPRHHVGLGSDMDGGFGADRLPISIDCPADLNRLLDGLCDRNWPDDDLYNFASGNWARFFKLAFERSG
jgi:membrane dipeptidase